MFFRCQECGHIFEEGEQRSWVEPHGERLSGCPLCFGNYVEAKKCNICGSYNCDEHEDYCKNCKIETIKKFNLLLEDFSEDEKEILRDAEVEI